jgi:1,3-beta-glucan synthase
VVVGPIVVNAGALLVLFFLSCCAGPVLGVCCKQTSAVMAGIAHGIAVIVQIIFIEVMWFLQGWIFMDALLGIIASIAIQRLLLKIMVSLLLTREFKHDQANRAWWSGKWYSAGLGWMAITQPSREFVCKIVESMMFAGDFLLGHALLFFQLPFLCIPLIDRWHSMLLFWLRPSRQIRPPIFSMKQNKLRKRMVRKYAALYFAVLFFFLILIIAPAVGGKKLNLTSLINNLPNFASGLVQPTGQNNNDTGPNAPSTVITVTPTIANYTTKP